MGIVVGGHALCPTVREGNKTRELPFFVDFPPGSRVLDIGCGDGGVLRQLRERGCRGVGLEIDSKSVEALQRSGYETVCGRAEQLPFADGSFDGIVCSVVIPYTDEQAAVAEWSRVMVKGGQIRASYHGLGYALNYICGTRWRRRFYGARMILNTWVYRGTGRRLPGWLGDTLYQSSGRLARYYRGCGLRLEEEYVRPGYAGIPGLLFHQLTKK